MTEDVEMISTEVDNRGRTASLNSNNNVANMTNKTNNEETTSITSMEKTCAFNNNMPSEISLTTEIRTPSLGEESLISTSIKKTFDDVMVKKCDDEVQRTTRRKSTTVLGEVNEYHSNNWHDLSQFGNRSAAENDNSDEVDNENIAEDDTIQSMSEVRGDNTLKELVSEVKEDNTLKESMLFHETLGIEQRAELAGVISGTDSNSTGFSIIADTNLKDKESKPLTADQETIDATERMSTDYNISNAYSEAVLYAKQDKMEVNDVNDLKDNVLNIDNYDRKRQINCQELDGENQEIDGENQELDGENRELDGENRELDDENRELEDKNRDLYCENQELDSKSEDLIDKIQDMIDDLEYLENKGHNIADEEKLLEDDDDQESENHYQRNGGCKALNCKMDYYYQNVVYEDPEFDADDQELIDADQGSHENEISEPSVVTTETECGSISLSTSEFTNETESESLGKSSVITNETECGSIAKSASQFTTETECGSISLSTSEFTTETENESPGKSSVITNEIAHGTICPSLPELRDETEGESLAESSEVEPVAATESESLAESSVVTQTEYDDLSQSTQEFKIEIENEILAESSVVETEHVIIDQCLPCVTTETERIFQSLEKLSVKNESSSKSVEQTDLLERRETGTGGDETVVKLKERTCILDSKHGLKKIEFVETETRNKLKEYQIERQDTVAKIIPTELKTTKNCEPSEIKLVENNEIPTELKTTKNCEPSEIKLVENNEIPTELKTTKNCEPSEIKLVENNEIPTELKTTKNCEPSEIKLVENNEIPTELKTTTNYEPAEIKLVENNEIEPFELSERCIDTAVEIAGDSIINKSSTASTENCNSLESTLINKLSQTDSAHSYSDFEMSQENLENEMKFRSDSPSEYELVIIGPHHLVNGFNDQKVYGTVNNSMFENEEKSNKLDTEEILCENRPTTKSIMSSEVNLTKEVNMENVDRDQGLTQYTGESQDVHNDLDLTQYTGELQDVHNDLDLTQCTGESQDVHHDLYLTQYTGESQDVHHDLDLTQCTGESQDVDHDLDDEQELELSQEHTSDITMANKAQFSSQHYMRNSPDRNCGRFSKYLTSKIGDSKHDDDEKMQHKKLVPVHNILRGYTFSGASAGDAISIMGTIAGDDNDMVGTSPDDERLIMDLDRENSDINNTMCENKVYTNLKTKETPSSRKKSEMEKFINMIFDEGIKDSDSNCIQMLPLNVDEVTLKSNLVKSDAESIVEELPHIQDECYDLDDGESLDKSDTSGDGNDRIHNVDNAETATTSIYYKGKEYINLDVMIDSEENLDDIDGEEKLDVIDADENLDVINAEQNLDVIDGDEDVCVFSAILDDSTDSDITLSPDLYFDDSDSLPEVEFLKASPAKHPVIIKDEIFKVDSGLESDQDTMIIPFNKALITSTCTLVVDKDNTSSKSDVNKRAKKEFVFHCTPRDDDASSGKKCGRIPDCTPTKGKFKAETSNSPKHKLKLTKCEKIKVLKKKKKETSLPRKKICQKELGENDNNPRKCKYKREDFSPRTKTSQREIGTNENMPCKSRSRKRRLDNSPKINDTPAKEGKKSKKKRKVGKCHSRIISDDIEIITDNESDTELNNEKWTMVKSEKLNKSLERKKEPSVVALTDEMSVTHNSVNQKGNVRVVPSWN